VALHALLLALRLWAAALAFGRGRGFHFAGLILRLQKTQAGP